jgi:hypothetical protein
MIVLGIIVLAVVGIYFALRPLIASVQYWSAM